MNAHDTPPDGRVALIRSGDYHVEWFEAAFPGEDDQRGPPTGPRAELVTVHLAPKLPARLCKAASPGEARHSRIAVAASWLSTTW